MSSWDTLRTKLAPNPLQHRGHLGVLGAMVLTVAGSAILLTALALLLGLTESPITLESLKKELTWRLILDIACLRMMWSVISNGNNLFGLYRPAGFSFCLSGSFAFVVLFRDLVLNLQKLPLSGGVLNGEFTRTTVVLLGALLVGVQLLRKANTAFARNKRFLTSIVPSPSDLRGLGYSLYLRTFDDDHRLSGAQSFPWAKRALRGLFVIELPEEMQLADALSNDDTPMVTVGRPGEITPYVGALRVYLRGDDWQKPVGELIAGARHVVLVLGWGEGTIWELREAMRVLSPEQLILVVPMEETEYERFRKQKAPKLPPHAGRTEIRSAIRGLVTFEDGWKGTFVPLRAYSPFHNSLRVALMYASRPALRRLGYPPRGVFRLAPSLP